MGNYIQRCAMEVEDLAGINRSGSRWENNFKTDVIIQIGVKCLHNHEHK